MVSFSCLHLTAFHGVGEIRSPAGPLVFKHGLSAGFHTSVRELLPVQCLTCLGGGTWHSCLVCQHSALEVLTERQLELFGMDIASPRAPGRYGHPDVPAALPCHLPRLLSQIQRGHAIPASQPLQPLGLLSAEVLWCMSPGSCCSQRVFCHLFSNRSLRGSV